MKRTACAMLLLAAVLGGAIPSGAALSPTEIVANGPAATLLLPYFEVNLANSDGVNTIFTINNASASAGVTHVTIWSDLAVPVLGFNVYLTGYDVQTVNLRTVLRGTLPRTADAGSDPTDTISPKGTASQDINFPDDAPAPVMPPPPLPGNVVNGLRAALTGRASSLFAGDCAALNRGDGIARGYVTIDDYTITTLRNPDDPAYYLNIGKSNIYWGEFFYTGAGALSGGQLVGIRAYESDAETTVAGQYTFYGRYNGWNASDNRQALPGKFAARFFARPAFSRTTMLIGWRDPKVAQAAFTCGDLPSWYPLGQTQIVGFDEQEHPFVPPTPVVFPPPVTPGALPFPAAAQKVKVGSAELPVPYTWGWIYFNLNTVVAAAGAVPPENPAAAQGWIFVVQDPRGRFSLGYPALQLESAGAATLNLIGY